MGITMAILSTRPDFLQTIAENRRPDFLLYEKIGSLQGFLYTDLLARISLGNVGAEVFFLLYAYLHILKK